MALSRTCEDVRLSHANKLRYASVAQTRGVDLSAPCQEHKAANSTWGNFEIIKLTCFQFDRQILLAGHKS